MSDSKTTPPPIPKPFLRTSAGVESLNDLLNMLNNPNIEGVEIPPGVQTKVTAADVMDAKIANRPPEAAPLLPVPVDQIAKDQPTQITPVALTMRPVINKIFFTGLLGSGKDYAAKAAGATIFGFADPIYAIASHWFGVTVNATEGKELPGMREFMQAVGQWGRATVNEKYSLTPLRALFCEQIRAHAQQCEIGHRFPEVDWSSYGRNPNIWLDAGLARASNHLKAHPDARVAITNCRFDHEFKALSAAGWQHWHVMVSPKTWKDRLAADKLTPDSPAVKDISEQLAAKLDAQVIRAISTDKSGPQLRVIWSDTEPKPSARLHTVETFLKSIGS